MYTLLPLKLINKLYTYIVHLLKKQVEEDLVDPTKYMHLCPAPSRLSHPGLSVSLSMQVKTGFS